MPTGGDEKVPCFCFCLFFTLFNGRDCANNFAIEAFERGNAFDIIGLENVCGCAAAFSFVSTPLGGATTEC